MIVGGRGGNL